MPGYTHLQRAQPVYLGHHLLAYFWMLERDAIASTSRAGPTHGDAARLRRARRAQLGPRPRATPRRSASSGRRRTPSTPSRTATSPSTTCTPRRVCATHLSRLGAEIVIWSHAGVRLLRARRRRSRPARASCRRRRTPTRPSSLRAKSPRVVGALTTLARRPARACRSPTPRTSRRTRRRSSTRSTRSSSASRPPSGCSPGCVRPRAAGRGGRRRDGRRDRRRRPARPQGDAVPRGPRRSSAGWSAPRSSRGRSLSELEPERARRATPSCSTTSTTRSCAEGAWLDSKLSRGRHRRRAPGRAARGGAAGARRPARRAPGERPRRSSSSIAPSTRSPRDLIGCELLRRRGRRGDRRDRELRARRSGLPRLRRADGAHRDAVRAAGPRLRLPLLRHPQHAQRRLRAGGHARRRC